MPARTQHARSSRTAARQMPHQLGRPRIVERKALRAHRLQPLNGGTRLQLQLLPGRQFFPRRYPQHIVLALHGQPARLQDDVQRLLPRHVLQAHRHAAGDRIRRHHVQAGEVGYHLQQRTDLDILEMQRDALTARSPASGATRNDTTHGRCAALQHRLLLLLRHRCIFARLCRHIDIPAQRSRLRRHSRQSDRDQRHSLPPSPTPLLLLFHRVPSCASGKRCRRCSPSGPVLPRPSSRSVKACASMPLTLAPLRPTRCPTRTSSTASPCRTTAAVSLPRRNKPR